MTGRARRGVAGKGGASRGLRRCSTEIRTRADLPRGWVRGRAGRSPLRLPSTDGGDTAPQPEGSGGARTRHTGTGRGGDKPVGAGTKAARCPADSAASSPVEGRKSCRVDNANGVRVCVINGEK